jgi:hypothetical protein
MLSYEYGTNHAPPPKRVAVSNDETVGPRLVPNTHFSSFQFIVHLYRLKTDGNTFNVQPWLRQIIFPWRFFYNLHSRRYRNLFSEQSELKKIRVQFL